MNIVSMWIERAKEKYGSVQGGVDRFNTICGGKVQVRHIYEMNQGKRSVSECVHSLMLNDILLTALEQAGIEQIPTTRQFMKLSEMLALPVRMK